MDTRENETVGAKFQRLVDILAALRGPGGCPWDREQDEKSIAGYFLEEVYEAVDALYRKDAPALAEELGDVLMEVVFLSRLYEERGAFDAAAALDGINAKMIRRHPHVFGGPPVENAARVLDAWVRQKREEKKRSSPFEGVPESAPALLRAFQIGQRAAQDAFDWPEASDALAKVREELAEIEAALAGGGRDEVEEEIGDALFALAQAARLARANPEIALRRANAKFTARFEALRASFASRGRELKDASPAEMDAVWEEIKKNRA
ncbi:MAG: nucleoside triphosphate pyrophosphohydrolase [Acidobacteriota bacterium]|nr:nucleoside triphosphate pyrophosphohydrolase [Acidobacteriota bacterium]